MALTLTWRDGGSSTIVASTDMVPGYARYATGEAQLEVQTGVGGQASIADGDLAYQLERQ